MNEKADSPGTRQGTCRRSRCARRSRSAISPTRSPPSCTARCRTRATGSSRCIAASSTACGFCASIPAPTFKKSAKIVGDVMGNFHPHGDQAIYDALVRLAQDFASRYPLVDGQGNFGNIDGDNAAAYRYTEARLTEAARLLLDGIDEDAVDFRPSYDGVIAGAGRAAGGLSQSARRTASQGIAVGMATAIPPHNIAELCDAALHLIEHAERAQPHAVEIRARSGFPDRRHDRRSAGDDRRSLHDRARLLPAARALEDRGHRARHLSDRSHRNPLAGAEDAARRAHRRADQREEAAARRRHARRIRRGRAARLRAALAQRRSGADDGEPVQAHRAGKPRAAQHERAGARPASRRSSGLPRRCNEWLAHRRDVLLRRSRYRLGQIEHRLEVLGGYLDRLSQPRQGDQDHPHGGRAEAGADAARSSSPTCRPTPSSTCGCAICAGSRRSRSARRTKTLRAEKNAASRICCARKRRSGRSIAGEIREVRDKFGPKTPLGKRRTGFAEAPAHDEAAIEEALVEREPVTVVVSDKGWIRALRGQVADLSSLAFKADDGLKLAFFAETTSKLLVFATNGRCYTIEAAKLPGGRGHGEPIRLFIELEQEADAISVFRYEGGRKLIVGEHSRAGASSSPRTSASPIPARASRCSTSRRPTKRARSRQSRASWWRPSARIARWWCSRSIRCRR